MNIEGTKVTQQDEGKWLKVVKTDTVDYPEGYETRIVSAGPSGGFTTEDNEGDLDTWPSEGNNIEVEFAWVLEESTITPTALSASASRKKLADDVRVSLKVFLRTVIYAEEAGIKVDLTDITKGVKVTFQPPEEEY